MIRSTLLDVFVHWAFQLLNSNSTSNLKVSQMPINLKEMLEINIDEAFLLDK